MIQRKMKHTTCVQEVVVGDHEWVQEAEEEHGWAASCSHAGKTNWTTTKTSGGTLAQSLNPWRQQFQLEKKERIKEVRMKEREQLES